ncbi:glycosyltransferase family 4 protein [Salegentibacter sp. F188]|uniref:Glycosyltransferase family 4 protein n=1 Tax=Autumnicola patrickiae TaxID=3075591 RepID=A0ABU3DXY1_9FLAO|nr:glycosyltransferase family 4 protein [Salegentibacter sp. F188]MDT0688581.1 glycosyltransferase family 4 protein [Salegentibacter sp. F188]
MKRLIYIGNKLEKHGASPTAIDTLSELLEEEGFSIITASSKRNKIFRLLDMMRTIAGNYGSSDLVLIDTYSTSNFLYAVLSAKLCRNLGLPYIPILHGGNLEQRLRENEMVSRELFGKAFCNVAPSQYFMKVFEKHGFQNLKYIPNSIPLKRYRFISRKKIQPKILWVRSFAEVYNPMLALKVLKILQKDFPDAQLCMVGPDKDGNLKTCRSFAEAHNLQVKFTGKLQKEEWHSLASGYDVFLNTSNTDNAPVSVIEAMALGLPVVSTNVGGIPYLVQNQKQGLLITENNEEEAAKAIQFLISNPEEAGRLILNARQKAEGFDWERVKEIWLELLC